MLPVKCNIKCRLWGNPLECKTLLSTLGGPSHDDRFLVGILKKQKGINFNVMIAPRYCREALIHHFNQQIYQTKITLNKPLYLIIYQNIHKKQINFHRNLDKALVILNSLERRAVWSLSRKMDLSINGTPIRDIFIDRHPAATIKCDYRWAKAPFMLSLLLLILRSSCCTPIIEHMEIKNEEDVAELINKLESPDTKLKLNSDERYLQTSLIYWVPLTKHYGKIFKGITKRHMWDRSSGKLRYVGIEDWSLEKSYISPNMILTHKRAKDLAEKPSFKMEVEGQ